MEAHLIPAAGGSKSLSAPTTKVWQLRYTGSSEDLRMRLGQADFAQRDHDAALATQVKEALDTMAPEFSTTEGKNALQSIVSELDRVIDRPTEVQRILHQIGKDQALNEDGTCFPGWAPHVHVFVTADVADEVQELFEGEELRPYHVLVADQFRGYVDGAIAADSSDPRPGLGKAPRARPVKEYPVVQAYAAFCRAFYSEARCFSMRPASLSSRGCASTGYRQNISLVKLPPSQEASHACASTQKAGVDVRGDQKFGGDSASVADTLAGDVCYDLAEAIIQRLLGGICEAKPPVCKNEKPFSDYVVERFGTFHHEIVHPFVHELEQELCSQLELVGRKKGKAYLDRFVDMIEMKLFGGDVLIHYLKSGQKALEREHRGGRLIGFVQAFSESVGIFAAMIKDHVSKAMPAAKKAAWISLKPHLDTVKTGISIAMSRNVGKLLAKCIQDALVDANPQQVATVAYKQQRGAFKASRVSQYSAEQQQAWNRLDRTPLGYRAAWMIEEASRHLDAGGSSGQYSAACSNELAAPTPRDTD